MKNRVEEIVEKYLDRKKYFNSFKDLVKKLTTLIQEERKKAIDSKGECPLNPQDHEWIHDNGERCKYCGKERHE